MKLYKFLYSLIALLPIAVAGCDDSDDWTPGPQDTETGVKAYFELPSQSSYIFESEAEAESMVIPVTVGRENTAEAMSLSLSVTGAQDGVSVPASVAFAAGEKTATFNIDCSGLELAKQASFVISLPADQTDIYGTGLSEVAFTAIKSDWTLIADNVRYLYLDDENRTMYPTSYGTLYHLQGTYLFKFDDFFGSGLEMNFECKTPDRTVFVPLSNADFESAAGQEDSPWYLYNDAYGEWPVFVPGNADASVAIQYLEFWASENYAPIQMIYTPETLYGYTSLSVGVSFDDGSFSWGTFQADFNLQYNPFVK